MINKVEELKEFHIDFIVRQFACLEAPESIQKHFKETYYLTVSIDALLTMNPGHQQLCVLGSRWKDRYDQVNDDLMSLTDKLPIANKMTRLKILQETLDKYGDGSDDVMCLKILQQARLEVDVIFERIVEILEMDLSKENYTLLHSTSLN